MEAMGTIALFVVHFLVLIFGGGFVVSAEGYKQKAYLEAERPQDSESIRLIDLYDFYRIVFRHDAEARRRFPRSLRGGLGAR